MRALVCLLIVAMSALLLLSAFFGLAAFGSYQEQCPGGSDCPDAVNAMRIASALFAFALVVIAIGVGFLRHCRRSQG